MTIRVVLPYHLRNLARVSGDEVQVEIGEHATIGAVVAALEARYPALCGTIRDHDTQKRRPFVRFYACREDLSHEPAGTALPGAIKSGEEPFIIMGAMSGG